MVSIRVHPCPPAGRLYSAIGDVLHLDAGHAFEQFAGQMRRGADAGRAEGRFAPVGFCECDELLHGFGRRGVGHDHQIGDDAKQRDRRQVGDGIVARVWIQIWIDRQERCAKQQRVAVGLGVDHRLRPEVAGCAAPVLDHDLLAPHLRQAERERSPECIAAAAGRERHHQAHMPVRIGLRGCVARQGRQRGRARCEAQKVAAWKFHGVASLQNSRNAIYGVRPEGACDQWRQEPPGELSICSGS